jgi:hypothetical protein
MGRGFEVQGPHQQPNASRAGILTIHAMSVKADFTHCPANVTISSRATSCKSAGLTMWWRPKTVRLLSPVPVIATGSEMPLLTMFLTAVHRKSSRSKPRQPACRHAACQALLKSWMRLPLCRPCSYGKRNGMIHPIFRSTALTRSTCAANNDVSSGVR